MAGRGVAVDHATPSRRVDRCAGLVAEYARRRKQPTDRSWRPDGTSSRVRRARVYLYRAAGRFGQPELQGGWSSGEYTAMVVREFAIPAALCVIDAKTG